MGPFLALPRKFLMNTIKNETTATVRSSVNERRLFETMGHWFATSFSIIGEVMQNARRAGATKVEFEASHQDRRLEVIDDGCGIDDYQNLIDLCTSGWTDEQVVLSEKPFGMGLFSLFYACDSITIRSRGQMLTARLEDIVHKREIHVTRDPNPVIKGTRILLSGLKDKLMAKVHFASWKQFADGDEPTWQMYQAIAERAQGFDIPVIVNGVEVPQPFARRNIVGQLTSVGFVSVVGIHTTKSTYGMCLQRSATRYFLQGLPIEISSHTHGSIANIVHLDSERFIALMPDRAHLQDSNTQLEAVDAVMKAILGQFLTEKKANLAPAEFVVEYFRIACANGFKRLFNDVPYLPASIISVVSSVDYRHEDVWNQFSVQPEMVVTREDLLTGVVQAWRSSPSSTGDGAWAATLLKVMQSAEIAQVDTSQLDAKHWVFDCVPSTTDFKISVTPNGPKGSIAVDVSWESCVLTLVDSLTVVITSAIDPSYRIEHEICNDWLVAPADNDVDPDTYEGAMICYFTESDSSPDHPASVFSAFTDEYDAFIQDWQDDAISQWNSLMAGLRGCTLSATVKQALVDAVVEPTPNQSEHITVVRLARNWRSWNGEASNPVFDVVDLQAPEFWSAFAANLDTSGLNTPDLAEQLRRAFYSTVKPNELLIPGGILEELARVAGYKFMGEGESFYVLLPGEGPVDFESPDHNYMGFFSSREAALEEVHEEVVKATCLWHDLSGEQWSALTFTEQFQHVQKAHAQRIIDAKSRREAKRTTNSN